MANKYLNKIVEKKHKLYSEQQVVDNIRKAEKMDDFLKSHNLDSIEELDRLLNNVSTRKNLSTDDNIALDSKNLQEILISYGITSEKQLKEALSDKSFASLFEHTPVPTQEMFHYAQAKIERAKIRVLNYLKTLKRYNCEHAQYISQTVLAGVTKDSNDVHIVVRPSDNREVLIYDSAEKDALDYVAAELWVEDGRSDPQLLTLGAIIKKARIQRIPLNRG